MKFFRYVAFVALAAIPIILLDRRMKKLIDEIESDRIFDDELTG